MVVLCVNVFVCGIFQCSPVARAVGGIDWNIVHDSSAAVVLCSTLLPSRLHLPLVTMAQENEVELPPNRFDASNAELMRYARACGLISVRCRLGMAAGAWGRDIGEAAGHGCTEPALLPSCVYPQQSDALSLTLPAHPAAVALCSSVSVPSCSYRRPRHQSSERRRWRRASAVWCTPPSG